MTRMEDFFYSTTGRFAVSLALIAFVFVVIFAWWGMFGERASVTFDMLLRRSFGNDPIIMKIERMMSDFK
ncbi:ABC-type Fe3+ transport system permease subunit [Bacillus thermophilus]|uniref:Uncharacterized protein n=2 Tax=Siminovitchia TaxID=2837510 RepID=A0A429X9L8_SIMTE|nr:hypothetical protein [Siminovitchia terrae]MBM7716063.1 ABC-type Fe3+ transport system permease subunit [Siminovitchia thermophila]RST60177.1 hypothetical protein D5F11_008965 [Siminovitchia terrae]